MALDFPWQAFLEAQRQKNANRQQFAQTIGGTLANLGGDIGQIAQVQRAKAKQAKENQQISSFLNQQAQPIQRTVSAAGMTNAPVASYDPQSDSATPMTQPNPNAGQFSALRGLPPEIVAKVIGPMIQQQAKAKSGSGKPMKEVWRNQQTGEIRDTEPSEPGWSKFNVSDAQALQQESNFQSQSNRNKYLEGRVDVWKKSLDNKQIDTLVKHVGLTPQNITTLQQGVARAERGMEILQDPNVTWQKLHAAGVDFAGIMQGGVPSADEVRNSSFPNWHEKTAHWDTFINGDVPTNVPPAIRQQMIDMLAGASGISQKFLESNDKFTRNMIEPTLNKPLTGKQKSSLDEIQKVTTSVSNAGQKRKGLPTFNSEAEVEAAKLPKGTRIMINGRAAVIE